MNSGMIIFLSKTTGWQYTKKTPPDWEALVTLRYRYGSGTLPNRKKPLGPNKAQKLYNNNNYYRPVGIHITNAFTY
jgi:hypothetical protein